MKSNAQGNGENIGMAFLFFSQQKLEIQLIEADGYKVLRFLEFFRFDFIITKNNLGTNISC